MKAVVILSFALFVAVCSASPVALDQGKEEKPMRVVDVPAGIFEAPESDDKKSTVVAPEADVTKAESLDDVKNVEKVEPVGDKKKPVDGSGEEGTNVFGIRFPSILIIRRPPMFQDPFAGFQSPFFGGFNRRPIFAPPPFVDSGEQPERVNERETVVGSDSKVDEQKINDTVLVNNVIQRMHQQFNNIFSNLFNPNTFGMQRPAFPQFTPPQRPFFSRPSIFAPVPEESSEEDRVDFDKLPANYSNSTSETKLIDGQLVTVNKTVHKISGNNSNGFFHFSVINVRPNAPVVSPDAEKVPSTPLAVEVKPIAPVASVPQSVPTEEKPVVIGVGAADSEMDPSMNEVDRVDNKDKLPEVELKSTYEIKNGDILPTANNGDESVDVVEIVPIKSEKLIQASSNGKNVVKNNDLSSDIRVNNLMAASSQQARVRALFDPEEVEIFEV